MLVLVKKLPSLPWFLFCSLDMAEMCHLLILSNNINKDQSASISSFLRVSHGKVMLQ
jgi:hypothetical protein